jgi:hypothetical protein
MSQKERDAFVAGAIWARGERGAADEREALRRYPDETPAQEPVRFHYNGNGELVREPAPPEAPRRHCGGVGRFVRCGHLRGWVAHILSVFFREEI